MKRCTLKNIILLLLGIILVFAITGCNGDAQSKNYSVEYFALSGGDIIGETSQTVDENQNARAVTAVPHEGYVFVEWLDGFTSATREDKNINANLIFTARFKKLSFQLQYTASDGGTIQGAAIQEVDYNTQGDKVTAVPHYDYLFEKWSDGCTNPSRQDTVKENKTYSAIFKKIFEGDGTITEPFLVSSYQDFLNMKYYPDNHFVLSNDLDFAGVSHEPIFDEFLRFEGSFDGGGKTIKNLTVNTNVAFPSLFGFIGSSGKVENLNISEASILVPDIASQMMCVGILSSISHGELKNIKVSGEIISNNALKYNSVIIGGMVGWQTKKVENCHAEINIQATNIQVAQGKDSLSIGGLIGFVENDVTLCSAVGEINLASENEITKTINVGGLVGIFVYTGNGADEINIKDSFTDVYIKSNCNIIGGGFFGNANEHDIVFKIENCYSKGNIDLKVEQKYFGSFGGFIGLLWVGAGSSIENCYSTGSITAYSANGFAYDIIGTDCNILIKNCYATGNIFSKDDGNGFASGLNGIAYNCYSTSNIVSYNFATGFIDSLYGEIKRCYSSGDVYGKYSSVGFVNLASGKIEECFSSGNIESGESAVGFIFAGGFNLLNCYSTSNIYLFSLGNGIVPSASGFVSSNRGNIENCYYSGKITSEKQESFERGYIDIFAYNVKGDIINCHWLYDESNGLENPIGWDDGLLISELTRYDDIQEMFAISNVLNGQLYTVWEDVLDSNNIYISTPRFKK